jgi:hypothetical protein
MDCPRPGLLKFPKDMTLLRAYDAKKKERAHLRKILKFAEGDVLYPSNTLLGANTGRFTTSNPEFHNFNPDNLISEKELQTAEFSCPRFLCGLAHCLSGTRLKEQESTIKRPLSRFTNA